MDGLIAEVQAALRQGLAAAGLAAYDGPLVTGVSGGPDSLALLDILARLWPAKRLIVAHLDHGLRPTSAAEAEAVAALAGGRGLRCHVERADVAESARQNGLSLEDAARQARYAFLARVAQAEGAAAVAVGHNAGDQAETVLLRLLRGAGAGGLRGMSPAAPLPGRPELWLLRPLLGVDRATIEAYCVENGLQPLIDESNRDPAFRRNRVRHDLLPALERDSPQLRARLLDTAAILAAEDDLLTGMTDAAWHDVAAAVAPGRVSLWRAAWLAQPLAIRRRLLRRAVAECRPPLRDAGFAAIEAARRVAEASTTGARVALPRGMWLLVAYDRLELFTESEFWLTSYPQLPSGAALSLPVPGMVELSEGWRVRAVALAQPDLAALAVNTDPWTAYAALEPGAALFVRPRRPGERMRPLGLNGTKKLTDVMIDRKLPGPARPLWPLVATAEHPVWLAGHILDERARVRPDSTTVVCLHCELE